MPPQSIPQSSKSSHLPLFLFIFLFSTLYNLFMTPLGQPNFPFSQIPMPHKILNLDTPYSSKT